MSDTRVYTVDEAAEMLGLGRQQAYQAVRENVIPHIRIGRRIIIPKVAFDRWLDQEAAAAP